MAPAQIRLVTSKKFIGFQVTGNKYEARERGRSKLRVLLGAAFESPLPDLPSRSHPLYGPILKVRVANAEIEQLGRRIKTLANTKRNSITFEDDPDPAYKLVRLVVKKRPDPVWSVRIGEIIHNLRSALDIAVSQLSVGITGSPAKPYFPIHLFGKTKKRNPNGRLIAHFDQSGRKSIKYLPKPYRTIIERSQPYHAGSLRSRHPV